MECGRTPGWWFQGGVEGQIIQDHGTYTKEFGLYCLAKGELFLGGFFFFWRVFKSVGKQDHIWNSERSFCEHLRWWLERVKQEAQEGRIES